MASSPTARRIYLTDRLVNKQITMEEATELFTLMSRELDRLRRQAMVPAGTPASGAAPGSLPPPPPGWSEGPGSTRHLEDLLLFGGPLLGILAALLKRSGVDQLLGTAPSPSGPSSTAPPPRTAPGTPPDRR